MTQTTENLYQNHLDKNPANHAPLTPLGFIERSATVFPDRVAVVHGQRSYTWAETYARSRRLASALSARGIGRDDTVAVMGSNTPELYEAHFGVPMAGAVLNALNVRLDAETLAFILDHGEAKVLFTDKEFSPVIAEALPLVKHRPIVIDINDSEYDGDGELLGEMDYEAFLATGDPQFNWTPPADEWQAISLSYTSGTTGNPKGVVYHHRGAYLNGIGNAITWAMPHHSTYLWTLPMFHCNGWCFPWTLAAISGTSVCLRRINSANIHNAIADHGVTHLCGAPIIMNFIVSAPDHEKRTFDHTINMMTAAAPPPASVLAAMKAAGFNVTHAYGLTETYGPAVVCAWNDDWDALAADDAAKMKSRQGVRYVVQEGLMVANPESLEPVPFDGETMGEVFMRGNLVMRGYLKNPGATEEAFRGGWFHTGDLGVMHPDGYIQLKDRSKDIIISGGENISSIEVEGALVGHPAVMLAAVVAKPDDKWGETPCAFVELNAGAQATEAELIAHCRDNLAHYKCPKSVVFCDLPKTSTGKIQKFILREKIAELE